MHRYSAFMKPPVTDLVRLPDHESMRVIQDNAKLVEKLNALAKPSTEFYQIDVGDGILLDGWCIKPPGFDPASSYPVLFHVYGEPSGQNVRDVWRGKAQLWHWMLAQQGYVVMSVDNRGTPAPRGRDWRKIFYRQVGTLAAADLAAVVRASFQRWPWIDPNRVAIWGWSGGGSMTLNALFRYPDLFHAGMAVAPVSNLRHYDTIYQERYTGLPADNAEGYRLGSPITHAHRLEGHLLLVHGTGDDNVHYQGTEALINELIAHNKPFTMMTYPNRSHAIDEGPNTRRHLFSLLTSFLHRHLPATAETLNE
jgi:dipeptidyl-peptidase-4